MSDAFLPPKLLAELRALEVRGMELRCQIWRKPAPVNGIYGPIALFAADIPITIRPTQGEPKLIVGTQDWTPRQVPYTGFVPWGTDITHGDEVRIAAVIYAVEGVGVYATVTAVALSQGD